MPRRLDQTTLGISQDRRWDPVRLPNAKRAGESRLLRIPPELIGKIIDEILCSVDGMPPNSRLPFHTKGFYATAARLALVCHIFHDLTVPKLYRHMYSANSVLENWAPESIRVRQLYRSIKQAPMLGRHCRSLGIYIPENLPIPKDEKTLDDQFAVARDLVTMLPNVTVLFTKGGFGISDKFGTHAWHMLDRAVHHMPDLQFLGIRGSFSYNMRGFPEFDEVFDLSPSRYFRKGQAMLREGTEATCALSTLYIVDFAGSQTNLRQLLKWSASLERLYFRKRLARDSDGGPALCQEMLVPHAKTLRILHVDHNVGGAESRPDLSKFTALEEFGTSAYCMDYSTGGEEILAPELRTFHWKFEARGANPRTLWTAFGQREEDWLRRLSRLAISRKSKLQRIKIDYSPHPYHLWPGISQTVVYPWKRMDAVRDQILRPANIELVYTPTATKEEFALGAQRDTQRDISSSPIRDFGREDAEELSTGDTGSYDSYESDTE